MQHGLGVLVLGPLDYLSMSVTRISAPITRMDEAKLAYNARWAHK